MLRKITFFAFYFTAVFGAEHVYLKTPNLSPENIIGTNVGIRPYRKSGVRLEAEFYGEKLIIHNYGYGGSGLTLSFGGAKEVIDILEAQKSFSKTVAVLGGGVIGLATAYDLLEKGYEVHLYSNKWSPNLTSNVAAGIWSPLWLPESISEEKKSLNERMLKNSEKRFLACTKENPEFPGVRMIDSYRFKSIDSEGPIKGIDEGEDVVVHFDNGVVKNSKRLYMLAIDGKLFIEDLYSKVKKNGALLEERHFETLEEVLSLKETVVINCMSMGSRELFNDLDFVPIRGQLIYFQPQEGVDYLLYEDVPTMPNYWVSTYPWSDRIILGGVYEWNEGELESNPKTLEIILKNAQKCLSEDS